MRALALLSFLVLSGTFVSAVDRIVAYGDSFTDSGNDYKHSGFPPSPPYWQGRFSNGPTWFDQVGKNLELKGITASNNAYGGATTNNADAYSAFNNFTVPDLLQQIETIDVGATDDSLFIVYIGYNDLNAITNPEQYVLVNKNYTKEDVASNIVTAIKNIRKNYDAKNILILNTPPFYRWPTVSDIDKPTAKKLTEDLNDLVKSHVKRMNKFNKMKKVKILDDYTWWNNAIDNPQQFGLKTTNGPCVSLVDQTVCSDTTEHFFWDNYHPEAKAHKAFGDWVTNQIESLYNLD